MTRLLLLGDDLCDRYEDFYGQKPNAVLVVTCQVLKQWYDFLDDDGRGHSLDKFGHVIRSLSPDHRSIIVNELPKLLAKLLL